MNGRERGRREPPVQPRAPRRAAVPAGGGRTARPPQRSAAPHPSQRPAASHPVQRRRRRPRRRRGLIALGVTVGVVCCLILVFSAVWNSLVKPPDLPDPGGDPSKKPGQSGSAVTDPGEADPLDALPDLDIDEELPAYISDQKEGVYTFLVLGRSDENNLTDMIMLVVFDTNTGTVNAASIPRDTMVNLSADIKKINAASGGGVERVKQWVRKTTGIQANFYVLVDWQAVGDMVDAVGGVDYNVPFRMYYIDTTPGAAFTIDLQEGWQHLDGDKAMQVIRWRKNMGKGYSPGDVGRIQLQQHFIRTVAYQFLQPKNITKIGAFATIFQENVDTDLSLGNLVWFAQKALEKDSVNKLTFHTLPGDYSKTAYSRTKDNMQSYVTLYPDRLLTLINDHLNPYNRRITLGDLDLMSINADGTISSSTGTLADQFHNKAVLHLEPVEKGLAHFDKNWDLVYEKEEDDPGAPPSGEGDTPDGDPSGAGDRPDSGDAAGTGSGGEDIGASAGDDPSGGEPEYDSADDPNYDPDPWAAQREEGAA